MRRTTRFADASKGWKITVSTSGLMEILECGKDTAIKIGMAAGARIQVGKRVLWNVEKIQGYLNTISDGNSGDDAEEDSI